MSVCLICRTILSHHIRIWCSYASDRHDNKKERTQKISILIKFLSESKQYNFPSNIRQSFEVDCKQINDAPIQSIHDRIAHSKSLIKNAKSNRWFLRNNIKRYFGTNDGNDQTVRRPNSPSRLHSFTNSVRTVNINLPETTSTPSQKSLSPSLNDRTSPVIPRHTLSSKKFT